MGDVCIVSVVIVGRLDATIGFLGVLSVCWRGVGLFPEVFSEVAAFVFVGNFELLLLIARFGLIIFAVELSFIG